MNNTIISAVCSDQSLHIAAAPILSSGGIESTLLNVDFSSHWDGFEKTAVFYRSENTVYHVLMDNDSCFVPREVLSDAGAFYFGVMGIGGEKVRTSDVVRYSVRKGAITEDTAVSDPTPDIYSQLLCRIAALEAAAGFPDSGTAITAFIPDETLTIKDGVLSVNTADAAEENNTLPITSAAVYTEIGNINVLLETI